MGPGRGSATRTCTVCGSVWAARAARFCGRCGGRLGGPRGIDRVRRRGLRVAPLLGLTLAASVVGGLVVAVVAGTGDPVADDPSAARTWDAVELPRPAGTDAAAAERATVDVPILADLGCDPQPCVRWRRDLAPGEVRLLGGVLLHAAIEPAHVGAATGERRPPTHEIAVTALGTSDGEVRWTQRLAWPSQQGPEGVDLEVADGELVLVGGPGELHALDARDGERYWSAVGDVRMVTARSLGGGEVALWGERPSDDAAGASEPVLVVRDRDTGDLRWQRIGFELVVWMNDRIVGLDRTSGGRELVAFDRHGEERWRRVPAGTEERLVAGSRVLALVDPTGTEVVDLVDGATLGRLEASVARGDVVTFVGDTRTLARRRAAGDGVVTLVDPAAGMAPTQVTPVAGTGVARLHALRTDVPWEPPPTDLLLTVRQDRLRLDIRAFGPDGGERWRQQRLVDDPTCCWQLGEPGVAGTVGLVPPRSVPADIELLSAWDGSTRGHIPAPSVGSDELRRWNAGIVEVVLPRPTGPRVVLHGVAGSIRIDGRAELVTTAPVPVVRTSDGLLGLDPAVFLAP